MGFVQPRPLEKGDPVAGFDCGAEALNRFLERYAHQSQQSQSARTYVTLSTDGKIAGYYTLAYGSVEYEEVPERTRKGLARHEVPVMVLARLAVANEFQGQGIGKQLLRDALLRTLQAADIAGLRAVVVDAKDEKAKQFYERFRFEPFPGEPLKLALFLKDLRTVVA
ncbi:MAG TPA: GNAT family N-acetyltransferase [Chryseolinea sp.]